MEGELQLNLTSISSKSADINKRKQSEEDPENNVGPEKKRPKKFHQNEGRNHSFSFLQ
jgi:hypothetical protein